MAKITVNFGSGCPTLINDEGLVKEVEKNTKELLGAELVVNSSTFGDENTHRGGSEDFSYVSKEVPTIMLGMAAGEPEKGFQYHQHHPKVTFDEEVLKIGSAVMAYNAYKWLEDNN